MFGVFSLVVVMVSVEALLGFGWPIDIAMLVASLGSLGYLCSMVLGIFGGFPLSGLGKGLLMVAMFVLLSLTVLLPLWRHDGSVLIVTKG